MAFIKLSDSYQNRKTQLQASNAENTHRTSNIAHFSSCIDLSAGMSLCVTKPHIIIGISDCINCNPLHNTATNLHNISKAVVAWYCYVTEIMYY